MEKTAVCRSGPFPAGPGMFFWPVLPLTAFCACLALSGRLSAQEAAGTQTRHHPNSSRLLRSLYLGPVFFLPLFVDLGLVDRQIGSLLFAFEGHF